MTAHVARQLRGRDQASAKSFRSGATAKRAETPLDPATLSLVPTLHAGLTKLGHVAVSVGAEFPVVGERSYDARVVAFFLWEYADGGIFW